jgi:hypothetical protein
VIPHILLPEVSGLLLSRDLKRRVDADEGPGDAYIIERATMPESSATSCFVGFEFESAEEFAKS